jgi:hypothetical protein
LINGLIMFAIFNPMKRLLLMICLAFALNSQAQPQLQATIKKAAQTMANAVIKADFNTAINLMYPKMVTNLGGREKIAQQITNGAKQMKATNSQIFSINIGQPATIVEMSDQRFSLVPTNVTVSTQGRLMSKSYPELAVSDDKGKTWFFMDGDNISDAKLQMYFPKAASLIIQQKRLMGIVH